MQGIVFSYLADMVIEQFGMAFWNNLLAHVKPLSEGVYTTNAQYQDEEIFLLVNELSRQALIPVPDLLRAFGAFLFPKLLKHMPIDYANHTFADFLLEVDQVIHREVARLYPNVYLPTLIFERLTPNSMSMLYQSKRKLCYLAEGLLDGAAKHFDTALQIRHVCCMHDGADACRLRLDFLSTTRQGIN